MLSFIMTYLRGIAMGAADVVPGVSGGTIAFITGIYGQLLEAISTFNIDLVSMVLRGRFREAFAQVPWKFLIPLVLGIGTSIFSLARIVLYLLEFYPNHLWGFFFGLILASAWLMQRDIAKNIFMLLPFAMGFAFAWWLCGAPIVNTSNGFVAIFFSAFVAICAMILPGISGAFVLVLLGKYQYVLEAVHTFNLPVLLVFLMGCAAGLLTFARVVSACLRLFPHSTMAMLLGLMAGALRTVWPWKVEGLNSWPPLEFSIIFTLLCCVAGIALPLLFQKIADAFKR